MAIYKIDAMHSEIGFKVRHLMISNVNGKFDKFDATLVTESDSLENAKVTFEAEVNSISTGNEQRDGHVKSAEFFDAATYPTLTFTSTSFTKVTDEEYVLKGDLTIRGKTNPVELKVEYNGEADDAYGNLRLGFELNGKINRQDYDLTWSGITEAGNIVLSDEVKLHLNIQLIKQP